MFDVITAKHKNRWHEAQKHTNILQTERCNLLKTIQLNAMERTATFIAKYNLKEHSFS